jgi:hypothetical protein
MPTEKGLASDISLDAPWFSMVLNTLKGFRDNPVLSLGALSCGF